MNDTYKVIHVEEENENHPGLTIYTLERQPDGFKFKVKMWDIGMFSFKSLENKQIEYSTELKNKALEAIKHYKLTKGLKKGAKEAWSDILEFKEYFTEAEAQKINYDDVTFKLKHIAWLNLATGEVSPNKQRTESSKVYCFKDSRNGTWWLKSHWFLHSTLLYQIIQKPTWYKREKAAYKKSYERALFEKKFINEIAPQLIKHYELTNGLKKGAKEAWSDILESKDISNMCEIEDITQEDMYGDDIVKSWKLTRHFNHWQEVTYFISLDKDGHYQMYDEEGNDLLPDKFEKESYVNAIKQWDLINGLKRGAKEAWRDILESKSYEKEAVRIAPEDVNIKVVGINHEEPAQGYIVYDILLNDEKAQFIFYPNEKEISFLHEYPDWMCNKISSTEDEYGNEVENTEEWDIDDYWANRGPVRDTLKKRILGAILSHGLKKGAKEAWSDILESKASSYSIVDKMTERQLNIIKKNYPLQWGNGYVINYTYSKLRGTEYGNSKYYAVKILNAVNPECYIGLFSNKYAFRTYYSKDSDIGKLVDHYELTNNLKKGAKEAWSDILEFKDYFQG